MQDRLTLADLAVAAPLMHMAAAKLPVLDYKDLQRWFACIQELDAWRLTDKFRIAGRAWREQAS